MYRFKNSYIDNLSPEEKLGCKAIGMALETKAIEGKFTADFVLEAAKDQDLPSQMREIMNAFAIEFDVDPYGDGHINDTFTVILILQSSKRNSSRILQVKNSTYQIISLGN